MSIEIENRNICQFSTAHEKAYANEHWDSFLLEHLSRKRMVPNVDLDTRVLRINGQILPISCNLQGRAQTSWVSSLRNTYGPYARAETDVVGLRALPKLGAVGASHLLESLLRLSGLDGGIFLNNWLVSTNLYRPEFEISTISLARLQLAHDYPEQPIIIRSLTPALHFELMRDLLFEGFHLLPMRQVWLLRDPASGKWRRRSDVRKDLALEHRQAEFSRWVPSEQFTDADFARAAQLYEQLYRQKYPVHNPMFDADFFRCAASCGWMDLRGLRRTDQVEAPLCGVIGMLRQNDWLSCPLLGYDLQAPIEQGLYRRLYLKTALIAEEQGRSMHCSAGAGNFKAQRGAEHDVEFAAVYVRHISKSKEFLLRKISQAAYKWAVPYMKKHIL